MPKMPGHPDGWTRRAIGDVAAVSFSSVDKKSVAGEVPVRLCNYMDVWKNHYIDADLPFMDATATSREIKQFTLVKHDVLLTKDSETKEDIADPAVVRTDRDDLVLGYHLALVRPDPKKAHGPFIAAQLALPQFRAQFVRVANGATRYGLGIDDVRNGTLLLPGVEEQEAIAEYLGAVDATIDATRGVIEQARRLKTAVLQDLLTRGLPGHHSEFREVKGLGQVPRAWKVTPLAKLIDADRPICYGILMPGRGHPGGVPVVKVKDLADGRIKLDDILLTTPALDEEYKRSRLRQGDILVSIRGTTGRIASVPAELHNGNITQDTARLSISDECVRDFVFYCLQTREHQAYIQHHTIGQAVKGINIAEVRKIPIPLPEADERQPIVQMLRALDRRIESEQATLAQQTKEKTALSQALLTGRVRVPANTVEAV